MLNMMSSNTMLDLIHGTIVYSGIESEIINTTIFNRLQRISQSSLAFLTFPSNKVKRFEHSIGTMYLSGEIFYNSICNAEKSCLDLFFKEIEKEIANWRKSLSQNNLPKELKNCKGEQIINESSYPESSFYNSYLPGLLSKKEAFLYLVAFQSIRIAGLLHDVGHLPYSHLLENALKNLYICAENDGEIDNSVKKEFLDVMRQFVRGNDAIHEEFGKLLVESIKECIINDLDNDQTSNHMYFFFLITFDFAKRILCSKFIDNNIFADMHLIISGVVDADRLDYCSRDYYCAALDKSIFNYKQFINGYTLIQKSLEEKNYKHFLFCPSSKNLSMIEELLRKRYRIFSDINYHHRVHKHEIILEKIICELGLLELQNMNTIEDLPNILPFEISSIWKLVKELKNNTVWLEYQLIQMDDSWLDTLLKHKFFVLYDEDYSSIKSHGADIRWNQFDELISTRKHYFSLIKRSGDFQLLDKSFYEAFMKEHWTDGKLSIISSKKLQYSDFIKENKSFFFNYIIKYVLITKDSIKSFYQNVEEYFNNNFCQNSSNDLLNCIIRSSRFSCGLDTVKSPVFLTGIDKEPLRLENLSSQRNSFLAEEALTPPFHFYYLPKYDSNAIPVSVNLKQIYKNLTLSLINVLK